MSAVRFPSIHRMIGALQILPTFLSRGRATFVSNVEQDRIWSDFLAGCVPLQSRMLPSPPLLTVNL